MNIEALYVHSIFITYMIEYEHCDLFMYVKNAHVHSLSICYLINMSVRMNIMNIDCIIFRDDGSFIRLSNAEASTIALLFWRI